MLFSSAALFSTPNLWLSRSRGKEEQRVRESGSFRRVELHRGGIFKGRGQRWHKVTPLDVQLVVCNNSV